MDIYFSLLIVVSSVYLLITLYLLTSGHHLTLNSLRTKKLSRDSTTPHPSYLLIFIFSENLFWALLMYYGL